MSDLAPKEILAAVERLCHSRAFDNQENARRVVRYIAKATLDALPLSERSIAIEALGRRADFNPREDSIVRVTTVKLKQLIETYNESEGAKDAVIISIPKGTYNLCAELRKNANDVAHSLTTNEKEFPSAFEITRPLWPHLYSAFMALCCLSPFEINIGGGRLKLPQPFEDFFRALGNPNVFVTTFDSFGYKVVHIYPICSWLPVSLALAQTEFEIEMVKNPYENSRYYGSYETVDDEGEVRVNTQIRDDLLPTALVHIWCEPSGRISFCDSSRYSQIEESLGEKIQHVRRFIRQYKS